MRFLADMGISPVTVAFLNEISHDATHLLAQGLNQMGDAGILKKERILLVHDLGFGDLLAAGQAQLPSVVTFRLRNMQPANVNEHVRMVIEQHREVLEQGAIFSVTEGRARWHALPLGSG